MRSKKLTIRSRPGRDYATSSDRTTFASSTYARLRALNVAPCGLIPRLHLCIAINSARDVGSDQWAVNVPFDYLFDVSFGFLFM